MYRYPVLSTLDDRSTHHFVFFKAKASILPPNWGVDGDRFQFRGSIKNFLVMILCITSETPITFLSITILPAV